MRNMLDFRGLWFLERWSADGRLIEWRKFRNSVTTAGLNAVQDIMFRASSQLTTWYAGLIDNTGYTAVAAADTMSSHTGWTESTAYSESTRPQWSPAASSGGILANGTAMTFTFNATTTIRGGFVVSNSTKGGTTGTLWATALSDTPLTYASGEVGKATYTMTAAAGAGS